LSQDRSAGLHWLHLRLLRPLDLRRPGRVSRAFHGQRLSLLGAQLGWTRDRWRAHGEVAVDARGRWALVTGIRLTGALRLAALARRYPPGWWSPLAGSASSSGMSNESGALLEARGTGWRAYLDQVRRPQPTYTVPLALSTSTWGLELEERLRQGWLGRAAFQQKRTSRWSEGRLRGVRSRRARLETEWGRDRTWRLRLEARHVAVGEGDRMGLLLSARWRHQGRRLRCTAHGTRFLIPTYDTRIYEYEYEVPGAVTIRGLYGDGWRAYGLLGLRAGPLEAYLRVRCEDADRRPARREAALQLDFQWR
jgi:hypothetical protein